MKYKYDFHCHVHEGSKDSKVSAKDYLDSLIKQGFTGLLVTDHNTYNGYSYIVRNLKYDNFVVLKGIEYSTLDAGHFLVIMPDEYELNDLENKSAKLVDLIKYVHEHNGVLGPAHPFSEPYLSIFSSKKYKNKYDICKEFDFIEVFNAGEKEEENRNSFELANKYNLFITAGSDAHYIECCGKSYIELNKKISSNNDLISYINKRKPVNIGGENYRNKDREVFDKFHNLVYFFEHIFVCLGKEICRIK